MKMATKLKPQGPRFERFEFWTNVARLNKPQGPFWQFTLKLFWLPLQERPEDNDRYVKNCRNGRSPKETRWWFHDDEV
ncbi:hypothetical protein HanIR_Chr09g0424081 [Helianthus annuus]|nr:hypothetical protein HanIR_Chr09g0424081 [Helianthus annuus]